MVSVKWFSLDFGTGKHTALFWHKAVHTHALFFSLANLLIHSNCVQKENMLLKFNVRSLSVSVRISFELGNQRVYLCLGMTIIPYALFSREQSLSLYYFNLTYFTQSAALGGMSPINEHVN